MTKEAPPTPVGSAPSRTASEDPTNLRGGAPDGQAPPEDDPMPARRSRPPHVHLVVGPVGAGKSTFATALAARDRALRLTLDDWMTRLFRPDRPPADVVPWYVERAARCVDQIWIVARAALALGIDVVLEIGLLQREQRAAFYRRVEETTPHAHLVVHVLDADRDVRRARVARRNEQRGPTFSVEVPPAAFELASDLWQPPDDEERRGRDLRITFTDALPESM